MMHRKQKTQGISKDHTVYVGCCMIVLHPDGTRVLIAQRKKEPDMGGWQLPGGTVEYGHQEHIVQAVIRETFEETGIKIETPQFLCVMNTRYDGKQRPLHIAFVGKAPSEDIPPNPEPACATDWMWADLENLPGGKWFRLSLVAIHFYKQSLQNPLLDRLWMDQE